MVQSELIDCWQICISMYGVVALLNIILPDLNFSLQTDVEDYLLEVLQNENLSARAREQRDAILSDIKQLKERFVYPAFCFIYEKFSLGKGRVF